MDGLDAATVADVRVAAAEPLMGLPFEAALLPSGRAPVLLPAVRMWRALAGVDTQPPAPAPGPLKVLVAVGAPDEGQTPNVPLDVEAEMGSILDAVSEAVRDERAQVRILEVAHPEMIRRALAEDDYHVLHLSGHGSADGIELEDEDGQAVRVCAADLVACFHDSGKAVPLVVLSSCHGGGSAKGFAVELHRRGVSRVLAMQGPVTDSYATGERVVPRAVVGAVAAGRGGVGDCAAGGGGGQSTGPGRGGPSGVGYPHVAADGTGRAAGGQRPGPGGSSPPAGAPGGRPGAGGGGP